MQSVIEAGGIIISSQIPITAAQASRIHLQVKNHSLNADNHNKVIALVGFAEVLSHTIPAQPPEKNVGTVGKWDILHQFVAEQKPTKLYTLLIKMMTTLRLM